MSNEVTLALSAFLDSWVVKELPDREVAREVGSAFFSACYEDLGKVPRLLEEHDMVALLRELLPARLRKGEVLAQQGVNVVEALLTHLDETEVVLYAWELRQALDRNGGAFEEAVRQGTHAGTRARKQETVAHKAGKTGRNDPCWCGSGKKFKKCCGKNE